MTREDPRVVVLVTEGCHLCEDACRVVASVCDDLGIGWVSRDLFTLDEDEVAKWREYVPVVLIDGAVHDVFRVTAQRFRSALAG